MINFRNKFLAKVYKYIYIHDQQTILIIDIQKGTGLSRPTVIKYVRWLEHHQLIKKTGKFFQILPV